MPRMAGIEACRVDEQRRNTCRPAPVRKPRIETGLLFFGRDAQRVQWKSMPVGATVPGVSLVLTSSPCKSLPAPQTSQLR
jgi:hypothetical protein